MIQRYFIHLAYDGSNFHGWQRQPNGISVQQALEEALSMLLKRKIELTGAGRTDSGVHASAYYAHFELDELLLSEPINKLVYKLNSYLGPSLAVFSIFPVGERDHARFSALSRTYQYYILRAKDPFRFNYAYFFHGDLDITSMNIGAAMIQLTHDFTSFTKAGGDTKHHLCNIFNCHWEADNRELVMTITANRFLRNMVRSIAGTLLDVGRHRVSLNELHDIIEQKDRSVAGESVPAKGLFLTSIQYPESIMESSVKIS
jgi:tRNA pseudouridine38-40 synthase